MIWFSVPIHILSGMVFGWAFYAAYRAASEDDGYARLWWGASFTVALLNLWLMFTFMRGN